MVLMMMMMMNVNETQPHHDPTFPYLTLMSRADRREEEGDHLVKLNPISISYCELASLSVHHHHDAPPDLSWSELSSLCYGGEGTVGEGFGDGGEGTFAGGWNLCGRFGS